ncbi:hypothetical protein ACN4EE_22670 [Geminocystis sp. CENA526]|uniref:hypothetical protein n=1 Tax=Geminocystis sp. CENA526 TaxID=1355871 RepID=UPI003D70149B
MITTNFFRETIDKVCFTVITVLTFIIVILVGGSLFCQDNECLFKNLPHVEYFSWRDQKISSKDRGFSIIFDRPMSQESVEENLRIEPSLDGRISWSGKRMVFTLNNVIPYGRNYRLSLKNAQEKFRGNLGADIDPFVAEFPSRDRAFAYIGSQGEESGRLILNNSTKQNKTILTPEYLTVIDFKFTPDSERIVFSAIDENKKNGEFPLLDIYEVSTGLSQDLTTRVPSQLRLVLEANEYQNNKFDLAGENGEIIIVQRINYNNPEDFDLWRIEAGKIPQRLNTKGGDFIITPDRKAIAIAQGEGIAILPLDNQGNNPQSVNFLPKFGQVVTFSADGNSAAMIDFNKDNEDLRYTKSLFYVNNQGLEKELINIEGSIVDCKFNGNGKQLFCLLTELIEMETEFQEKPYFVAIDIQSQEIIPLLALPKFQDMKISLAPDGFGILFDQLITENDVPQNSLKTALPDDELFTDSAELILSSRLWLLTLPSAEMVQPQLEELPIAGFKPQWSP